MEEGPHRPKGQDVTTATPTASLDGISGEGMIPLLSEGTRFAERYVIRRLLGDGAAGAVYAAFDEQMNTEIALKVLHPGRSIMRSQERLQREVKAAREARHPNLIQIYDLGRWNDRLYLTMELVRGETLRERIRREGPLEAGTAAGLLRDAAQGLGALHAKGIVHRDVKSSNILIAKDGTVKVGDLGLAKEEGAQTLTADSVILGTPEYMAPEQALGKPVTPATDVYALGVVFYEMLAGEVPFSGESAVATAMRHVREAPDYRRLDLRKRAGRWFPLLVRMLEKECGARLRDGGEVVRMLGQPGRLYISRTARRRMLWGGAVLAALGAAVIAYFKVTYNPEPTAVEFKDSSLTCYRREKVLWRKEFGLPISAALLYDTDNDGQKEVVVGFIGNPLPVDGSDVQIPIFEGSGEAIPPLSLKVEEEWQRAYEGFSPSYNIMLSAKPLSMAGADDLVITLRHQLFFPSYTIIRSPGNREPVFHFGNPSWLKDTVHWNGRLVFYSGNAPLLHMEVLALSVPLASRDRVLGFLLPIGNPDGLEAYHLLETRAATQVKLGGTIQVMGGDGVARRLLKDGSLEGQKPGAAAQTITGLVNYYHVLEHFRNGRMEQAKALIDSFAGTAQEFGLRGYEVLFGWLEAERLARLGRWEECERQCLDLARRFPTYATELPLWAAFYRYLSGDLSGAKAMWLSQPALTDLRVGKQWEMYIYVVFASILEGASPAAIEEEMESYVRNLPDAYWKQSLSLQRGWVPLMHGNPEMARLALRGALKSGGFEAHAAGYFLACLASGSYRGSELDAYAKKVGGNPVYLKWIRAVAVGDVKASSALWADFENESFHDQDAALMFPVIRRVVQLYPNTFPQ